MELAKCNLNIVSLIASQPPAKRNHNLSFSLEALL